MIPFLNHPYLFALQDWLLIAVVLMLYFHTLEFTKNPEHKDFDLSWKITTALMWPVCSVIFVAVVIFTVFTTVFSKSTSKSKTKKD